MSNLQYQMIKDGDESFNVGITLSIAEVKALNNVCVELLRKEPHISIVVALQQELEEVILYQENKLIRI